LAARLDPQHAEPVVRVVERHPLHKAGQGFQSPLSGRYSPRPYPSRESAKPCSS
jgi:hypothetical protein